MIHAGLISL